MKRQFVCERCGKTHKWDEALNGVRGFETLCGFCRTWDENTVWSKRRGDLLIAQGKSKDRWEVIHGIHVCPINRGIWWLYHSREDDSAFEKFFGNKAELRARCKEIANTDADTQ
ncbi:hypothetical protein O9H85_00070 [Paenibacillus filicis]|uniref:HNH endonuclease n=1 Tax=Paenibacillus gyeongsangnamensis TaxID=3388067 RepID=A0ABT4Q228_9BACL|nr:hypothetical protein [Paenibacillus filicis]MCZ8510861.1 hypothetical protein [Paenibacillus filicis]